MKIRIMRLAAAFPYAARSNDGNFRAMQAAMEKRKRR